jgi:hypothetical protein
MLPLMGVTRWLRKAPTYTVARLPQRAVWPVQAHLRAKCIVVIVSLEIVLMGAVIMDCLVQRHQRRAILEQTQPRAKRVLCHRRRPPG